MRTRQLTHSSFVRTLVTLVTSACIGGTGSGLVGISVSGGDAGLSGTTTVRASDGVATFTNLSVDRAGTYTLRASASGAAAAVTSSPFSITAAVP